MKGIPGATIIPRQITCSRGIECGLISEQRDDFSYEFFGDSFSEICEKAIFCFGKLNYETSNLFFIYF